MGGGDSFEADESLVADGPQEPAEPDDPREQTGVRYSDDTLIGGGGSDTLTGNRDDNDVLIGGDGDDQLYLQRGNTGTGGAGWTGFPRTGIISPTLAGT